MLANLLELSKIWDKGIAVIKEENGEDIVMLLLESVLYAPSNHNYNHELTGHIINKWISEKTGEMQNFSSLKNYTTYFENLPVHVINVFDINKLSIIKISKGYDL